MNDITMSDVWQWLGTLFWLACFAVLVAGVLGYLPKDSGYAGCYSSSRFTACE